MTPTDELDRHLAELEHLVARAHHQLRRGRPEAAAVAAQVAASYGWFNHPGVFSCRALEQAVVSLAAGLPDLPGDPPPVPGRVLHVASEVYGTGGHTQMLANWVAADPGHEHHLVLTRQRGRPLPDKLVAALGPDATVTALDEVHDRIVDRARALRLLARAAPVVVLHDHPDDVVPGLALATPHRPARVLAVNHADHVFWTGTATPDVVVNLRGSGAELCTSRRGVPPERMDTLIRPLALRARVQTRARARALLGVPEGHRLVVTAAAGSKYDAVDGPGFVDVLLPLLRERPGTLLLAAGPSPEGAWAALERDGLGRALGLLPDIAPLLEAADVYVDSYPFSSLTSMLEAAALGVPVVTLRPPTDEPAVLGADTPELEADLVVATSPAGLRAALRDLLDDDGARAVVGERTRGAVVGAHAGGAWARAADRVTGVPEGAVRTEARTPAALPDDVHGRGGLDHRVARLQAQTGHGQGRLGALELNAALLTAPARVALVVRLLLAGRRPSPRLLLSAGAARRLRAVRTSRAGS